MVRVRSILGSLNSSLVGNSSGSARKPAYTRTILGDRMFSNFSDVDVQTTFPRC